MCGTISVSFCCENIDFLIPNDAPGLDAFLKSQKSQPHFLLINFLMSGPVLYHTRSRRTAAGVELMDPTLATFR